MRFKKCRERDSNPHSHHWPRDFKSLVSTNSTITARQFEKSFAKVVLILETSKIISSFFLPPRGKVLSSSGC